MKHASIIPLIGGETIASERVFNARPEYIMSYSPFKDNDSHLLNYYNHEVPYIVLDQGQTAPYSVDVVSSVCPCAGLSQYHSKPGESNQNNQWMEKTANYVLSEVKPKVFWGENAPALVGKIGKFMLDKLRQIGEDNGYNMSVYLTKNTLHGVPQFRKRTFYFFWDKKFFDDKIPLVDYFDRPYTPIEDVIASVKSNFQTETINSKTPSVDDPYYRYLLEEVHNGISHSEYFKLLTTKNVRGNDVESIIERSGHDYKQVGEWMEKHSYTREVPKCERKYNKLKAGGNIMRRGTIVPKDYIGAFVGHYPHVCTHPYEDRYLNFREAMTIMGLPEDFELLNPSKSVNHICQNVHVTTASDMAMEVKQSIAGNRTSINSTFVVQNNLNRTNTIESKTQTLDNFMQ